MAKEKTGKLIKGKPLDKFCKLARKLGAKDAKVISTKHVFTSPWVRRKCQYGCGGYGQCLTCPPYSPSPEETRKVSNSYESAILIHCNGEWDDVTDIVVKLERKLFLSGYYKALAFGAGPCNLCTKCNLKECKYPEKARPSMEASGIDVFKTARRARFPIKVLTSTECQPNYYGLVLIQ